MILLLIALGIRGRSFGIRALGLGYSTSQGRAGLILLERKGLGSPLEEKFSTWG